MNLITEMQEFDDLEENDFEPAYDKYGNKIPDEEDEGQMKAFEKNLPYKGVSRGTLADREIKADKTQNVHSTAKLQGRRAGMAGYIDQIKNQFLDIFDNNPDESKLYYAFDVLYDWTYGKLEAAMSKSEEEARQWMRVANDLIELDEYALMESETDMVFDAGNDPVRTRIESLFSKLVATARGDYSKEARLFMQIGFALLYIIEDQIKNRPDETEEYMEIKETLDRRYGPMFNGLQNQVNDLAHSGRRYGRATA